MALNVVSDSRWNHEALGLTPLAQRLSLKLPAAPLPPSLGVVPTSPGLAPTAGCVALSVSKATVEWLRQ